MWSDSQHRVTEQGRRAGLLTDTAGREKGGECHLAGERDNEQDGGENKDDGDGILRLPGRVGRADPFRTRKDPVTSYSEDETRGCSDSARG